MTEYGLTPEGFIPKPLEVIIEEFEQDIRSVPDFEDLDLSPESVAGKIAFPFLDVVRKLWELGHAIYNGHDPDQAIGAQQDAINALRGIRRLKEQKGKVDLLLTLAPGGKVFAGKGIVQVQGQPGNRWVVTQTVQNTTNAPAQFPATAESEFVGPSVASAGTITEIATPTVGWTAATNPLDAVQGRYVETHAEFRARAESELQKPGTSPLEAVVADVKSVSGVLRAYGFENTKDYPDVDGLPPHTIEIVVQGGEDADVAMQIWKSKGGAAGTHSSNTPKTSYVVTDSNGQLRTVYWTRPTIVPVYLRFTLAKGSGYPGDAAFKAAIAAWADTNVRAGEPLKYADMICQGKDQTGVTDAAVTLGFAPSPTGTSNLAVLSRQIIDVDTSRIEVVS